MSKNHAKTFRSKSSDHVPVVPTMVSSNAVGVKRIHVYRNADLFFQGIQVVINTHRVPSINVLLDVISERVGLINGAKKLYTMSGILVKDVSKIKDGERYVASSSHFTPMAYGGQEVEKKKKKKVKKRSKTVHSRERKEREEEEEEEVRIPFNEEKNEEKAEKKKKKKKKTSTKKAAHHHGSQETITDTVEVELPSEIEDSEEEEEEHHEDHRSRGKTPDRRATPSAASRRGSRKDSHEKEEPKTEEKRRKSHVSTTRRKSHQQPNWGDLSSFTKNIDSLLRN
ncbi:unnamed protein product [Caenorhabditis sp. 36 PRJEB53466]|nr:unnamed protein product [Caenorhabditis sp. 36 PRJEB53466]